MFLCFLKKFMVFAAFSCTISLLLYKTRTIWLCFLEKHSSIKLKIFKFICVLWSVAGFSAWITWWMSHKLWPKLKLFALYSLAHRNCILFSWKPWNHSLWAHYLFACDCKGYWVLPPLIGSMNLSPARQTKEDLRQILPNVTSNILLGKAT